MSAALATLAFSSETSMFNTTLHSNIYVQHHFAFVPRGPSATNATR
jgi:hypothetical protein